MTSAPPSVQHGVTIDRAALRAAGIVVVDVDAAHEPQAALAAALRFPAWFGGNLDAMEECLRDLPRLLPARGWVVVASGDPHPGWRAVAALWPDAAQHLAPRPLRLLLPAAAGALPPAG